MRTRVAWFALALPALFAVAVSLAGAGGDEAAAPASPLVVHEWGTFTSVQGSDGVALEGLQHEEEGLPSFVYSRSEVRECPLRQVGWKGLEVPATHVTQKMETPVLYFHTATERRVRVRVDFVKGILSQWYPVSDLLGPPEGSFDAGPLDLGTVDRSFLQWDVDLLPKGADVSPAFPPVEADDPWAFARDVDAATVRTLPRRAPERQGPTETERFLFYRGLGSFSIPVTVRAGKPGVLLANGGEEALPHAWSISVGKGARYRSLGPVPARSFVSASFDGVPTTSVDAMAAALKEDVARVLVAQGLFADEAKAMVETWSRQWFLSEGTRFMYLVPRATTDAILPLSIDPKPDALVRVLVGRLEYLTPERETLVRRALLQRKSPDTATRERGESVLASLGRFLEPNVRRILGSTDDPEVKASAEEVLAAAK